MSIYRRCADHSAGGLLDKERPAAEHLLNMEKPVAGHLLNMAKTVAGNSMDMDRPVAGCLLANYPATSKVLTRPAGYATCEIHHQLPRQNHPHDHRHHEQQSAASSQESRSSA